jgi:hypothetical protein
MFEFPLYLARQVGKIRDYGSFRLAGQLAVKLLSVPTVRISLSPLARVALRPFSHGDSRPFGIG